jgi:lysophospholipid acyltransferase (LPLAT)-like uncharacterized protein
VTREARTSDGAVAKNAAANSAANNPGGPPPPSRRKPVRRFMFKHVLPPVVIGGYRLLGRSWRYKTQNEEILDTLVRERRQIVGAFLHARTFPLLYYFSRPDRGRWILMCSQSRDGELMTRLEEGLGFRVARGSSGRGGARALVEMIKAQREDRELNSCLAIDGSRGPRGIAQMGVITMAQKTGGLILPVAASTRDSWVWQKSWDRTVIPKSRATIHIRIGEPLEAPAKLDSAGLEALRLRMQETLVSMHRELDEQSGFRDSEPLQVVRA